MQLPFTPEQFFAIIRAYNEAVWPLQPALYVLAMLALALAIFGGGRAWTGQLIALILAALWGWMGLGYHLAFFSQINPLAYAFAALSLLGAVVFLWLGVVKRHLVFTPGRNGATVLGFLCIVFALVIYPLWATRAGHAYPELPTFGLPCPTTIFTIGVLAFASRPKSAFAFVVPVLWSLIGAQAAFLLDVPPDLGLLVAGVAGIVLAFRVRSSPPFPITVFKQ